VNTRKRLTPSCTKIKTLPSLRRILASLKAKGKRIVFTNGCFDILHYGHVQYLEKAKRLGDVLVVALNSDASVRRLKGPGRPVVAALDRARVVAALESVDYVVLFGDDTPRAAIEALAPDILVKGADWKNKEIAGARLVRDNGGRVGTIAMAKGRSTTGIIETIAHSITRRSQADH